MWNTNDILETIHMIQDENLDIRTITMGISLLDCADSDVDKACANVYEKICRKAENQEHDNKQNNKAALFFIIFIV